MQTDTLIEDVGNITLPISINDALIAHNKGIVLTEQQKLNANISHLKHRSQEELIILTDMIKKYAKITIMLWVCFSIITRQSYIN